MDTEKSIFDTLDLDEIRRLIGEDVPAASAAAHKRPDAQTAEAGTEVEKPAVPEKPEMPETSASKAAEVMPAPAAQPNAAPPVQRRSESAAVEEEPAQPKAAQRAHPAQKQPTAPKRDETQVSDAPRGSVKRDVEKALAQHRDEAEQEKPPRGYEAFTMLHDLVVILAVLTLVFVFFFRLVGVDGESMIPTLYDRDYLILESNFLYHADDIERGDVIVLKVDAPSINKPIVKRVIATEGQTVDINFETGEVTVDGKILIEPYIYEPTYESYAEYGAGLEYPLTVPKGHLFVMGDDRNHSSDSRYAPIGCVSTDSVLGKVLFLVFPGRETDVYGNVIGKRDFGRIGAVS